MEISAEDLERDNRGEMRRLIERLRAADPEEVQDTVYRRLAFDLCPECQRVFLRNPLGREAAESAG
jgi:Zn-finger nucleic acid-binding protein